MKIGQPKTESSVAELEDLIAEANKIAPGNKFVASTRQFLKSRGFLTPKQIEALKNVEPTRSPLSAWDDEQDHTIYGDFGDLD